MASVDRRPRAGDLNESLSNNTLLRDDKGQTIPPLDRPKEHLQPGDVYLILHIEHTKNIYEEMDWWQILFQGRVYWIMSLTHTFRVIAPNDEVE